VTNRRLVFSTKSRLLGPVVPGRPRESRLYSLNVGRPPIEIGLCPIAGGKKHHLGLFTQDQILVYGPLCILIQRKGLRLLDSGVLVIQPQCVKRHEGKSDLLCVASMSYRSVGNLFVSGY